MNPNYSQEDQYNNSTLKDPADSNNISKAEEVKSVLPAKFKLDLDTPMESFLKYAMIIGSVVGLLALIGHLSGRTDSLPFLLGGVFLAVISGFLFFTTDNYYIIDTKKKMILYHFKFMTLESLKDFAPFSSIDATTVNGKRKSTKNRRNWRIWWEHRAEIVLNSGKVYPISNWKSSGYAEAATKAQQLAEISGANFVYSHEESIASPKRLATGKYTFESIPYTFFYHIKSYLLRVVIAIAVLFAFAYLSSAL